MENNTNDYLRNLRLKSGYTQQQVADSIGVTKATISKYEKGQRRINSNNIEKLASLFGVEPIYILTGRTSEDWHRELLSNEQSDSLTNTIEKLLPFLDMLNEEGQDKAVERVSELTEIPKYQKSVSD